MGIMKISLANAMNVFKQSPLQAKETFKKELACNCPPRKLELDTFKRSNNK